MTGAPMLRACGPWEHTSAAGNRYLVERWRGVKVLALENRDGNGDGEPSHHLIITEAAQRQRQGAKDTGNAWGDISALLPRQARWRHSAAPPR
jgi:hypothetical protein